MTLKHDIVILSDCVDLTSSYGFTICKFILNSVSAGVIISLLLMKSFSSFQVESSYFFFKQKAALTVSNVRTTYSKIFQTILVFHCCFKFPKYILVVTYDFYV